MTREKKKYPTKEIKFQKKKPNKKQTKEKKNQNSGGFSQRESFFMNVFYTLN